MKAIMLDDFGSADVLRLVEAPMPDVRPDDLLVKVMAAGVNRADLLQREGVYGSQSYGDSAILVLQYKIDVGRPGRRRRRRTRPSALPEQLGQELRR